MEPIFCVIEKKYDDESVIEPKRKRTAGKIVERET